MQFATTEIGSAKDNASSPVHNWYKFTAGFSYRFVDEIIRAESLRPSGSKIFDPFAGCGTTLVSAQKQGINAVGNEGQEFMYRIIRAKLGWNLSSETIGRLMVQLKRAVERPSFPSAISNGHALLATLYSEESLASLYALKDEISEFRPEKYRLFFDLALSQTLHKVAIHPIAVPYISRRKTLKNTLSVWQVFERTVTKMVGDLTALKDISLTSSVFLHDSRRANRRIAAGSCSTCITSPPYLNNLDYGEVSKVHSHFYGITNSWNDITTRVREKLVTGSTTHYRESEFSRTDFEKSEFYVANTTICKELLATTDALAKICQDRPGRKSFDILALLYFSDMYKVLVEVRRALKKKGKAFLILGDSAPYGVHIATTSLLGNIATSVGFDSFEIHKIRSRGLKWKTLTHRHSHELDENLLVLR